MRQWQALAAVILCALIFTAGLFLGKRWETANQAEDAIKAANDRLDSVLAQVEANNERAKKLQQTLDRLPKAEKRVNDAVAANPSNCDRPAAVADSLQQGIDQANAARKVPANP